ncbi:MAG TPA: hypothetical protein VKB88_21420 [Bryobacteraceae bacterium]|nr:hypothetical protein [Bryobacteraceae bacterium]
MALDPQISLAVRPVDITAQPVSPLQQYGQLLNLQNLMQQSQLFPLELQTRQLGLEQQRLAYQQALGLANLFKPGADTTQVPAAPGVSPANLGTLFAPIAPPQQPGTVTGYPLTGGLGLPGATLQPLLPDVTPPTAPAAAPPSPATTPVTPAAAPTAVPAFPSGGIPGLPSWQRMLEVGGASAFPWIKNINEAHKSQLEIEAKQLENAQGESKDMVRISNGMIDNESKNRLLPEAARKGYITWPEARQFTDMDVNDPRFQARKESWGQQALTYDQSVDLGIKRNKELRDQSEETRKWVEFTDKQHLQEIKDLQEKVKAMNDPSQFADAIASSPYLKGLYGNLVGRNLDEIKLWTGAGKPGETVPKPGSVVQQETGIAVAKAGGEATARIAAEDAPYVNRANDVQSGKVRWDQLPPQEQEHVGRILASRGYTQGYTTKLTDTESNKLVTLEDGLTAVQDMRKELTGPKRFMTGPWSDTLREIPVLGAKWEGLQGKMSMIQATVGDLIKGGVLRSSDQAAYERMFPKMTDDPWTVREKLGNLETKLTGDLARYKDNLHAQSRFLPGDTPPATPPVGGGAAPVPKPPVQTIEKTGTAGPRVTGPFKLAPTGKIMVTSPEGKDYWMDADKWPQAQTQGFTRK